MYIIAISEAEVIKEKAKPAHEKRSMDNNETQYFSKILI